MLANAEFLAAGLFSKSRNLDILALLSTTGAARSGNGGRPNPFAAVIIAGSVVSVVILVGITTLAFSGSLYFCDKNGLGTVQYILPCMIVLLTMFYVGCSRAKVTVHTDPSADIAASE